MSNARNSDEPRTWHSTWSQGVVRDHNQMPPTMVRALAESVALDLGVTSMEAIADQQSQFNRALRDWLSSPENGPPSPDALAEEAVITEDRLHRWRELTNAENLTPTTPPKSFKQWQKECAEVLETANLKKRGPNEGEVISTGVIIG